MRRCLLIFFSIVLILQSSCSKEDSSDSTQKQDFITLMPSQSLELSPIIEDFYMINDDSYYLSENNNPIDDWYLEIMEEYGNSHTDGWISYIYGKAWKAELQHLLEDCNNSDLAQNYYNAVLNEEEAINELMVEREKANWSTGSSGYISAACAKVYKNAVYQLEEFYSNFIFDPEEATQTFLND